MRWCASIFSLPVNIFLLWHLRPSWRRCRGEHLFASVFLERPRPHEIIKVNVCKSEQATGASVGKCQQCVIFRCGPGGAELSVQSPLRRAGCQAACLFLPTDMVVDCLTCGHTLSERSGPTDRQMDRKINWLLLRTVILNPVTFNKQIPNYLFWGVTKASGATSGLSCDDVLCILDFFQSSSTSWRTCFVLLPLLFKVVHNWANTNNAFSIFFYFI